MGNLWGFWDTLGTRKNAQNFPGAPGLHTQGIRNSTAEKGGSECAFHWQGIASADFSSQVVTGWTSFRYHANVFVVCIQQVFQLLDLCSICWLFWKPSSRFSCLSSYPYRWLHILLDSSKISLFVMSTFFVWHLWIRLSIQSNFGLE